MSKGSLLSCNGIDLYCEVAGDGSPMLLINGLGGDTRSLAPLVARLKQSCSAIAFDLRGAGRSEKPAEPYTISQMADDAVSLLSNLGHERVHIMGFSMGGCIAMEIAIRYPGVVDTLALVSTLSAWEGPYPVDNEVRRLFHRTDVSDALLKEVYSHVFGPLFKKRLSADAYVRMRMADAEQQPAYAYLNQLRALEGFDVRDMVDRIVAPTMIMAGDSDGILPVENARLLHERIPHSTLHILEGIGHTVTMEAPRQLAEHLIAHMKRQGS